MMNILRKQLRKVVNILKNYKFLLQGLECANCAKKIEDKIDKIEEKEFKKLVEDQYKEYEM